MDEHTHKLWHFPGGLRLESYKELSTQLPLRTLRVPDRVILPLQQHVGEPAQTIVEPGDRVLKGQVVARASSYISAPVHAPTSGKVVEITEKPVPHPSGQTGLCVVIQADGHDEWIDDLPEPIADYSAIDPSRLRIRVRECGIAGLGGAGFPSAVKLNPRHRQPITTLILNGVECEPYISCDDMLIRERAREILEGMRIIRHVLGQPKCVIAIEDDMPQAFDAMYEVLGSNDADGIRLVKVPARYPAGGERQLIKLLTDKEVPSDGLTADIGILCYNVATAYAVYRAVVHGEPLLSRPVTVTGHGVKDPCNVEVWLGTPVADVVHACGGYHDNVERLIMGGPMMGFAINTDEVPVVKATNCLLAATSGEMGTPAPAMPCIRCGECVHVCPARLLPHELYWHARSKDFDKTREYNLFDCIECGCCAYVCPSNLPLVHYYRYAKTEIWNRETAKQGADAARRRYQFRTERLQREKRETEARRTQRRSAFKERVKDRESKQAVIRAAIERVRAKKARQRTKPQRAGGGKQMEAPNEAEDNP